MLRWGVARGDLDTNPDGRHAKAGNLNAARAGAERGRGPHAVERTAAGAAALPRRVSGSSGLPWRPGSAARRSAACGRARSTCAGASGACPGARRRTGIPIACRCRNAPSASSRRPWTTQERATSSFPAARGSCRGMPSPRRSARAQQRFGLDQWTLPRSAPDLPRRHGAARRAPIVIAHVANHRSIAKAGVTFAHYVQHDYAGEKRAALDLWAERLTGIVAGGAEIVPLAARR